MKCFLFNLSFISLILFKFNFLMDNNQIKYQVWPEWIDYSYSYSMEKKQDSLEILNNQLVQEKLKGELSKNDYLKILKAHFNNSFNDFFNLEFHSTFASEDKKKIKEIQKNNIDIKTNSFILCPQSEEKNIQSYNLKISKNLQNNNQKLIPYYFDNFFNDKLEQSKYIAKTYDVSCIKNFIIKDNNYNKLLMISQIFFNKGNQITSQIKDDLIYTKIS
jgi:hypothetical protein